MDMHLFQRYENFFHGLETNNPTMVDESFENIKALEPKEFREKIKTLEDSYHKDIKKIETNALTEIQKTSSLDEVITILGVAEQHTLERAKTFNKEIKLFLIKWRNNINTT